MGILYLILNNEEHKVPGSQCRARLPWAHRGGWSAAPLLQESRCRRLVQSVWNNANRGPFPDHHDSIAAGRSRRRKATASTRPPMDGQHRAQMPFFRACLLQSARGSACTLGTYIRPGGFGIRTVTVEALTSQHQRI